MLSIGVTGLMASGKSDVSARFRERGAHLVEGDVLGWEVLRMPGVRRVLRRRFGPSVIVSDGTVDRAALGRLVFHDPAALEQLNAVVQPTLQRRVRQALRSAARNAVVVLDAALLTTWKLEPELDGVVEVFAPVEMRLERLQKNGFSDSDARARIEGQRLPPVHGARRYWRIDNTGTKAELNARADEIWSEIARLRSEAPNR